MVQQRLVADARIVGASGDEPPGPDGELSERAILPRGGGYHQVRMAFAYGVYGVIAA